MIKTALTVILFLLAIALLLLFLINSSSKLKSMGAGGGRKYGSSRLALRDSRIMTVREVECFKLLAAELGSDFHIFPQVSFSQILKASGGTAAQNRGLWMTMSQKVADFVICKSDFSMVAIVELDDQSHRSKHEKDASRDSVIRGVGLLALRLNGPAKQADVRAIADKIKGLGRNDLQQGQPFQVVRDNAQTL